MRPPRVASAIFPRTSTRTGPKTREIRSSELHNQGQSVSTAQRTCGPRGNIPNIHVLHAHDHIVVLVKEGAIEGDNVFGMAAVHDLKLANDTLAHLLLGLNMDNLPIDALLAELTTAKLGNLGLSNIPCEP